MGFLMPKAKADDGGAAQVAQIQAKSAADDLAFQKQQYTDEQTRLSQQAAQQTADTANQTKAREDQLATAQNEDLAQTRAQQQSGSSDVQFQNTQNQQLKQLAAAQAAGLVGFNGLAANGNLQQNASPKQANALVAPAGGLSAAPGFNNANLGGRKYV